MPGRILNVNQGKNQSYRLGLMLFPDSAARQLINQYVALRQGEIQREIRSLYEALYKLHTQSPAPPPSGLTGQLKF